MIPASKRITHVASFSSGRAQQCGIEFFHLHMLGESKTALMSFFVCRSKCEYVKFENYLIFQLYLPPEFRSPFQGMTAQKHKSVDFCETFMWVGEQWAIRKVYPSWRYELSWAIWKKGSLRLYKVGHLHDGPVDPGDRHTGGKVEPAIPNCMIYRPTCFDLGHSIADKTKHGSPEQSEGRGVVMSYSRYAVDVRPLVVLLRDGTNEPKKSSG